MMRTPFSWLAGRYSLAPRSMRLASVASVVASIGIVIGGGVVRVTGSGLGCPDWPTCTDSTLAPTAEMGVHGAIEFGNRALTGVLCVVVGWVIIAARLQRAPAPAVLRGGWAQFWVVVLNAVVGGITVWMKLSPYIVAAHFLAAMLLLTTAVVTWDRAQRHADGDAEPQRTGIRQPGVAGQPEVPGQPEGGGQPVSVLPTGSADTTSSPDVLRPTLTRGREALPQRCRTATVLLLVATGALVVLGTLATGSGPHAGDSSDVRRMPFGWVPITVVHGVLAAVTLGVIGFLLAALPTDHAGPARRRTLFLLLAMLAQGVVGVVQSLTSLPEVAVILHLFGSTLVWAGALRVALAVRRSDAGRANDSSATAASHHPPHPGQHADDPPVGALPS